MCDGRETLAVRDNLFLFIWRAGIKTTEVKFQLNTFYLLKAVSSPSLNVF